VNVTFNGGGAGAEATASGFVVLAAPSVTSTMPTAGYVSSTVTVFGVNFMSHLQDPLSKCQCLLGSVVSECQMVDPVSVLVVVQDGALFGNTSVQVTFFSSSSFSSFSVGVSLYSIFIVLKSPIALVYAPTSDFQCQTLTVTGNNFITPSQGGSCSASIGNSTGMACIVHSKTALTLVSSTFISFSGLVLVTFNGGGLGAQFSKSFVDFFIPPNDRVARKRQISVFFSFVLASHLQLPNSGLITLFFPTGFFNHHAIPSVSISSGASGTVASFTATSIVLESSLATLTSRSTISITLSGVIVGTLAQSSTLGIFVSTNADNSSTFGALSGDIGDQVLNVFFQITSSDRRSGKTGCAATVSFTTSSGGMIFSDGSITIRFPLGFFASTTTPKAAISGGVLGTVLFADSVSICISLRNSSISSGVSVSVTLLGITMGNRTLGTDSNITVMTSADMNPSNAFSSGGIYNKVQVHTFDIAKNDRVARKRNVTASFSFTSTVQGTLKPNSSIILNYPAGFFEVPINISVSISGGASATVASSSPDSIIITTSVGILEGGTIVSVTLKGLTMGPSSGGSHHIFVTTSSDSDVSDGFTCGMIGDRVTLGVFVIAGMGRIAHKTVAAITFSFVPSAGGALLHESFIRLMFQSGYLALGNSSHVLISGNATGIVTSPTVSSIIITILNATLESSSTITVTLMGFLLDSSNGASSGGVIISTSTDTFPVPYWGGCSCAHSPISENNFCDV
jgi:hypothetical protein